MTAKSLPSVNMVCRQQTSQTAKYANRRSSGVDGRRQVLCHQLRYVFVVFLVCPDSKANIFIKITKQYYKCRGRRWPKAYGKSFIAMTNERIFTRQKYSIYILYIHHHSIFTQYNVLHSKDERTKQQQKLLQNGRTGPCQCPDPCMGVQLEEANGGLPVELTMAPWSPWIGEVQGTVKAISDPG